MGSTGGGWKREPELEEDVSIDEGPWEDAGAVMSDCGVYRYRLWRSWCEELPRCVFVMLNPSTADAAVLDPTVRRCVTFARDWGCGSLDVVNLFALRSTDPRELRKVQDPVGLGNDDAILQAARGAEVVVLAWGGWGMVRGREHSRAWEVEALLGRAGVRASVLGATGDGQPRHPLYLSKKAQRVEWSMPLSPVECRREFCSQPARSYLAGSGAILWWRLDGGRIGCAEHGRAR